MLVWFARGGLHVRFIVWSAVLALTAGLLAGIPAVADEPEKPAEQERAAAVAAADSDGDGEADRPDDVSAMSAAVDLDVRVEDLSARTETVSMFARPDGSWQVEASSSPRRVKDTDGVWAEIDLELELKNGAYRPKAAGVDAEFGAGGSTLVAKVAGPEGDPVELSWPKKLPEPTADGATLTYPDVVPGGNLVVTALAEGFTHSIVLNEAPDEEEPVEFRFGIASGDAEVSVRQEGHIKVADGKSTVVRAPEPLMWDAGREGADDRRGRPARPVAASVDDGDLVLSPDMGFLTDPGTEYPVTIDPTFQFWPSQDTWIDGGSATTSQSASPFLAVGDPMGNFPARTFLKYNIGDISAWTSDEVVAASVTFSVLAGGACTEVEQVKLEPITSAWDQSTLTWANQPTVNAGLASYNDFEEPGSEICDPSSPYGVDATASVKSWAGGATNHGLRVMSANPSNPDLWLDFETNPVLSIAFDTRPGVPTSTTISPAKTFAGKQSVAAGKPTFSAAVSDPDGGPLTAEVQIQPPTGPATTTEVSTISGATATYTPSSVLEDGEYTVRWRATDADTSSAWTSTTTFVIDTLPPPAPTVGCAWDGAATKWSSPVGAVDGTCTISTTGDTAEVEVTRNGLETSFPALSSGSTSKGFTLKSGEAFELVATAFDKAGNASTPVVYRWGFGSSGLMAPQHDQRTSAAFAASLLTSPSMNRAGLQWRTVSAATWTDATKVYKSGSAWDGTLGASAGGGKPSGDLVWRVAEETGMTAPASLEIRSCARTAASTGSWVDAECGVARPVLLVQHAFKAYNPTESIGPVSVALATGELSYSTTDAETPTRDGSLAVSRSTATWALPATTYQSVFGPGWVAGFEGPDVGMAGATVVDRTAASGLIGLVDASGETAEYRHENGTAAAQGTGDYINDEDEDAWLELSNGSPKVLKLHETDGTVTTWNYVSSMWRPVLVEAPGSNGNSTYEYNGSGLLSKIIAAPPAGVASCSPMVASCQAMELTYTTISGQNRLSEVGLQIWNPNPSASTGLPGTGSMTSYTVAKYDYNGSGDLIATWDPRIADGGSALKTTYTYQSLNGRKVLASITEPGLKPWRFEYNSSTEQLEQVKREQDTAVGSGDAVWNLQYGVATSGTGLPDVSAAAATVWGQTSIPAEGTAVFDPGYSTGDMRNATISYTTVDGRLTNTASYGADAWQFDATNYDDHNNIVYSLTAGNRAQVEFASPAAAARRASFNTYSSDGQRVETETGPLRLAAASNTVSVAGRDVTEYVYDDEAAAESVPVPGRPADDPDVPKRNLVVEERHYFLTENGDQVDLRRTRYRYDKIVNAASDGDGWELQIPTRTLVETNAGWATTINRIDPSGRTIETRTPQGTETTDGAGSDARSTKTVYYTGDTSADRSECRSKPAWAGQVCWTGPAGQPSGVDPILETTTTGYDAMLQPTRVEETSGTAAKITITSYDSGFRTKTSETTTSGLATADTAVAKTTITYSATTGLQTHLARAGGTIQTTGHDSWGRVTSYSDGAVGWNGSNTTVTTYNTAGKVATVNDGKGTTTYTYDGTDSKGRTERRGLVTALDTDLPSGPDVFTASYDADGNLTEQVYPGNITATTYYNPVGDVANLIYTTGSTRLLATTQMNNPAGLLGKNITAGNLRTYTYDKRGRLTAVQDRRSGCTTRKYAFSGDSNRISLNTYGPGTAGVCQDTAGATTVNYSYDAADRITTSGYTYDLLGRTRTVPAAHTSNITGSNLTIGYHANDMVSSLTQTVGATTKTQDFALDPDDRISVTKTPAASNALSESTNHYDSSSDSPVWTETRTRATTGTPWAATTWERYIAGVDDNLALTTTSAGVHTLQLTDVQGSIAATITIGATSLATSSYFTEYGLQATGTTTRYGWHGTQQRDTNTIAGLTLMGVRLYNPVTGLFLSRDPIAGGNDNTYTYPVDPINKVDLDGRAFWVPLVLACIRYCYKVAKAAKPITKGWRSGRELKIGNNARVSLGNKNSSNPSARKPHYHRKVVNPKTGQPKPGQGLRRHRPWEKKSTDTSRKDRF